MKTPHKHADCIKAWADGSEIQFKNATTGVWEETNPSWSTHIEYRIKPKPKPDLVYYAAFGQVGKSQLNTVINQRSDGCIDSLKLIFCAETLKLKSVEILK